MTGQGRQPSPIKERVYALAMPGAAPYAPRRFSCLFPRVPMADIKRVVLAYSGGLDTSIILKWIQETYRAELVTFTADLGQGEELEPARKKAEMLGAKKIYVEDLREEF